MKQIPKPIVKDTGAATMAKQPSAPAALAAEPAVEAKKEAAQPPESKKPKGEGKKVKPAAPPAAAVNGGEDAEPDVSRLDMRVGRIVKAEKHPDADALYVEEVDLGEGKNRTVVSGLVKHVPLEQVSFCLFLRSLTCPIFALLAGLGPFLRSHATPFGPASCCTYENAHSSFPFSDAESTGHSALQSETS